MRRSIFRRKALLNRGLRLQRASENSGEEVSIQEGKEGEEKAPSSAGADTPVFLAIIVCSTRLKNSFEPSKAITTRVSLSLISTREDSKRDSHLRALESCSPRYPRSRSRLPPQQRHHEGEAVARGRAEGRVIPSLWALSKDVTCAA